MEPKEKLKLAEEIAELLNKVPIDEKRTSTGIQKSKQDKLDILEIAAKAI